MEEEDAVEGSRTQISQDFVKDKDRKIKPKSRVQFSTKKVKFKKNLEQYQAVIKWWQKPSIQYAMTMVREIMEKLMGSNLVTPMDRIYMEKLKVRILEDFDELMLRRIKTREEAEYQRMKNLVLTGKIPFDEAPREMDDHIVIILENYCNELIEKRRAGYKIPKPKIPTYLYFDDTPDPASFLTVQKGHIFRKGEILCRPIEQFLDREPPGEDEIEEEQIQEMSVSEEEQDKANKFLYEDEEYRRLHYTHIMIRRLMKLVDVLSVYELADEIMKKDTPELLTHIDVEEVEESEEQDEPKVELTEEHKEEPKIEHEEGEQEEEA